MAGRGGAGRGGDRIAERGQVAGQHDGPGRYQPRRQEPGAQHPARQHRAGREHAGQLARAPVRRGRGAHQVGSQVDTDAHGQHLGDAVRAAEELPQHPAQAPGGQGHADQVEERDAHVQPRRAPRSA